MLSPARRFLSSSLTYAVLTATITSTVVFGSATPAEAATYSAPLRTAISQLPVATEVRTGYDRALFPHWKDTDGDCQDARAEVLIAESSSSPTFTTSGNCTVATGTWFS